MTLLQKLDRWPPFLVYAFARNRGKRPDQATLAQHAGMSRRTFRRIAGQLTWAHVRVESIEKFCLACGVEIWGDMSLHRRYYRHQMKKAQPFHHLAGPSGRLRRFNLQCAKWLALRS